MRGAWLAPSRLSSPLSRTRIVVIMALCLVGVIGYWNFSSLGSSSTDKPTDKKTLPEGTVPPRVNPIISSDSESNIKPNTNSPTVAVVSPTASTIHHAVLFSCSGWRLNKLPEVKAFIAEATQYKALEVRYVGGDPRFVFYDSNNAQVGDEVNVVSYKKLEIHEILLKKGLQRQE